MDQLLRGVVLCKGGGIVNMRSPEDGARSGKVEMRCERLYNPGKIQEKEANN